MHVTAHQMAQKNEHQQPKKKNKKTKITKKNCPNVQQN